jgi:hypothetical protein
MPEPTTQPQEESRDERGPVIAICGTLGSGERLATLARIEELERELANVRDRLEVAHDAKSVGSIAWLAGQYEQRATAAEAERDKLRELVRNAHPWVVACQIDALASLDDAEEFEWDDEIHSGHEDNENLRDLADAMYAALEEPTDNTLAVAERSKAEVERIVAERDKLREALTKLTLKWRMDDFNGKNFLTKREAAYEVEAALKEPTNE